MALYKVFTHAEFSLFKERGIFFGNPRDCNIGGIQMMNSAYLCEKELQMRYPTETVIVVALDPRKFSGHRFRDSLTNESYIVYRDPLQYNAVQGFTTSEPPHDFDGTV